MYIEKINGPQDLKMLNISQCCDLAAEIREALLLRSSKIGGHLASNLGIIELTIALHYVFDSPKDKFVFDVSHQCYTHKILTGRKDSFLNQDRYFDVCGYTNPDESEHDIFRVGHTSTSISLACGLAKARDLLGGKENVIAIIGDGSLSGGEALEGLNFAGSELNSNLIIIFNDNGMSIAPNRGGMYENFKELRETNGTSKSNFFKSLGYDYRFVKNGNDIESILEVLQSVKDINHPIVIHVCTIKGYGSKFAIQDKEKNHWVRPFDIETGIEKNPFNGERYDRIVRDYLIKKMKSDPKVVTMIAAVPDSIAFDETYRLLADKQFVDVGIAEEHALAMAAGIVKNGGKPIFATMSTFFQRTYDQISQELCINKAPITMLVINASIYATNDVTHIGIFDIAMMANIPNLVYLAPTNKQEYLAMLDWSIEQNEYPVAIRAPRNGVYNASNVVDTDYSNLNKFEVVSKGEKIAIIALGDFFQMGETVEKKIKEKFGLKPTLINPRYISGIDEELLLEIIENHKVVITLEDGILEGGFGAKVALYLAQYDKVRVLNYGFKKEFLDRYNVDTIMIQNRLTPELILEDIENIYE